MAGVVTTIDLEKAARNAKYVLDSASGKRKSYLTANFEITQKEKEQATPADLVNTATKLFFASKEPQKFKTATGLFTHLTQIAPSEDVTARVKQVTPVLEKARLKEIPRQLSMLLQVKDVIKLHCAEIEKAFAAFRGERFIAEQMIKLPTDGTGERELIFKKTASEDELLQLLNTTEGLAFAQRFPMIFNGEGTLRVEQVTPADQRLLKSFIAQSKGLCSPYAARVYWCIEAHRDVHAHNLVCDPLNAVSKSCGFMLPKTGVDSTEKNPFYEPTYPQFFEKILPSFVVLTDFCSRHSGSLQARDPASHPLFLRLYDICKALASEFASLNVCYRELYDEYHALSDKLGTGGTPLPLSCFPAIGRIDDAPITFSPLPTPTEYDAIACTLSIPDFSPSYPSIPQFKPSPTLKPAVPETITQAFMPKVEEKGIKDEKEPPRRSSAFERRTFTFSQKDQRVIDWETNPKEPLAGESYCTLSPDLQKEQIWRHGCSVLDPFVGTEYSRKGEWTNNRGEKQTAYFIQAEVECQGKTTRCVFQYAFDKDRVLYHRYAGERSNVQIVDDLLAKNRYENDFPTLDKSFELFKTKPEVVKVADAGETVYTIDPLDVITVKDDKYDLVIRIFRQG